MLNSTRICGRERSLAVAVLAGSGWLSVAWLQTGCADPVPLPEVDLSKAEISVRHAITESGKRVVASASSSALWGRHGVLLDAHGYDAAAQAAYLRAADIDPTDARWAYYLATLFEQSEPDQAAAWYRRALELRPSYAPGHIRLAQTLENIGQSEPAREHFRRASELAPNNSFAHLGLGQIALRDQQIAAAIEHLERAAASKPLSSATLNSLAQAYQQHGETERAQQLAARARDLPRNTNQPDPMLAEIADAALDRAGLMSRAVTYRDVGQFDRALEFAQRAARSATQAGAAKDGGAALLVADIYERLERYADAQQWASKAAQSDSPPQGLHELQARVLFELGNFEQAELAAQQAVANDQLSADGQLVLGRIQLERGQPGAAIEHLEQALVARPDDSQWRLLLFNALSEAGRPAAAARQLERLRESGELGPEVWMSLGEGHVQAQRFAGASEAFEEVLRSGPNPAALAGLVQSLLHTGGPSAAHQRLEQQVADNPQDGMAVLLLTDFVAAAGETARAVSLLRNLVDSSPDNAEAWLQLGHMQLSLGNGNAASAAYTKALKHSDAADVRTLARQGLAQAQGG